MKRQAFVDRRKDSKETRMIRHHQSHLTNCAKKGLLYVLRSITVFPKKRIGVCLFVKQQLMRIFFVYKMYLLKWCVLFCVEPSDVTFNFNRQREEQCNGFFFFLFFVFHFPKIPRAFAYLPMILQCFLIISEQ